MSNHLPHSTPSFSAASFLGRSLQEPRTTREVVSVLNAKRTAFGASRPSRFLLATLFLSLLAGLAPQAQASIGDALALRSLLSATHVQAAPRSGSSPAGYRNTPNGRTLIDHRLLKSGALLRANAATANTVPIPNPTQTFDINNPLPAFEPLVGYGSLAAINNDPTNSALFIPSLTPTNLHPVWSADQTFIVFSSNRTLTGDVQPDGRFHIWAIAASGGEAYQITGTSRSGGAGEFFPALSANNTKLAFVSDDQTPGTTNLFVLGASVAGVPAAGGFSFNALVAYNNGQGTSNPSYLIDVSSNNPSQGGITPLTYRSTVSQADSSAQTGFDIVQRPTFSPGNDGLIVFSARSTNGSPTSQGHYHLYFLYTNSLGFDPNNNFSFPGKLTDGPADDRDPAWSQDNQFIAFASTASTVTTKNTNNSFGPNPPTMVQDPNQSQSQTAVAAGTTINTARSLFLISGGGSATASGFGAVPTQLAANGGRVTATGTDNFGPAWSYVTLSARNQYINPAPGFQYLAFARGTSQPASHDIYYLQTVQTASTSANPDTILAEGTTVAGAPNAVVKLNTDDNAVPALGGQYDDVYPTWSPFLSVFSIAYTSNRTVTYNDPATTFPSEVAVSVPQGGSAKTSDPNLPNQTYTVGANYSGLFQSQVLNLDPPTLLRFAPDQVLHIQAAGPLNGSNQSTDPVNGTSNKLAVTGSQFVTITARLSNREAGIDDNKVFVQIKDPDSKYQDARGLEHKVFSRDPQFTGQSNQPVSEANTTHTADGGTTFNRLPFGLGFGLYEGFGRGTAPSINQYTYPSYGTPDQASPGIAQRVTQRGSHGGHYGFPNPNNPDDSFIFVGKGGGGNNPNPLGAASVGGDPGQFLPFGPEYECQFVNPQFATSGGGSDTLVTDYRSPFYLAGVDDQQAFSGQARPPRPIANTTDANGNVTAPAEYLKMNRVPANLQDNKGGVLYSVTWKTPASPSDFYLDVIAYDKAVFPALPVNTSQYTGQKFNWRIYDNVGGFSTQQTLSSNSDILLVADYPLGQKFAATTFGGQNVNQNLIPKQFGTESYLTDVDVSILPDRVYAGAPDTPMSYFFYPILNPFFGSGTRTQLGSNFSFNPGGLRHQNGLGVGSYYDSAIDDGGRDTTTTPSVPFVASQKYTIWRILSRGPVPDTLLQSYQPTVTQQPAVADAAAGGSGTVTAQAVLDAHRCVVWLAPYTGSLLVDPGTLDDLDLTGVPNVNNRVRTQVALRNFVQNGGRLCITGQDVGSTLTLGGTSGNAAGGFLPDVLNASLASTGGGSTSLNATNNRIFGNALFDGSTGSGNSGGVQYLSMVGTFGSGFQIVNNVFPYQDRLRLTSTDQNDGAFDEIPANRLPTGASIQGQPDTLTALNGAIVGATYDNGGNALVFHDDPYGKSAAGATTPGQLPNGGTGSRTVYAAFNLGALSQDYYSSDSPNPSQNPAYDLYVPEIIPRNVRSAVIHNIVSYLRTGFITGKITQTAAGNGQNANAGVPGATVYVQDINGQTPSSRQIFSATTSQSGDFTISGVEPGTYRVIAYKSGYTRAVSNGNVSFTVEGDTTARNATLTINPVPPGNVAGLVQDTAKKPIPGATVTITSQDNTVTRTTTTFDGSQAGQPRGGFLLSAVPVTTYTIAIANGPKNDQSRDQYTPATKADAPYDTSIVVQSGVTTGDGSTAANPPVTFTLAPIGATVSGRVFSGTNDAAGGAKTAGGAVQAFASTDGVTPTGNFLASATVGVDGTYSLPGILPLASYPGQPTKIVIQASAPGFTPQTLPINLYLGDVAPNRDFNLVAIQPGSLSGTVTFSTGGPAAGASVTFTPPGSTAPLQVTTGADGTYNFAVAPAGTYSASAIGKTNLHGTPTTAATTPVQVTVTAGTPQTKNFVITVIAPSFSGTVFSTPVPATPTTPATPAGPLANALITVTDATTGATVGTTSTDTSGRFNSSSIPLADSGTYTIVASKASYGSVTALDPFTAGSTNTKITFYNGDAPTFPFTLTQLTPGTVSGTVTDNTGAVVPGATVTLTSTDGSTTRSAVTDGNGAYALPMNSVPAGSYTGTVVGPNNANGKAKYTPGPAQTVSVSPNLPTTANFTLTQILPTFAVTVTDATTTAAITNATVTFTPTAGGAATTVTANAAGVYTSPGLAPGTYTVTASAPGFFDGAASAAVDLGDTGTPLALALNQKGSVYGLVTDSVTGTALSGVTLTVTNTTGGTAVTTTPATITTGTGTSAGPDGALQNFAFSLPPGTYTLTATKANYAQSTSPVFTVGNVTPVRVNLALTSSVGTLGGLVTNAGSATPVGGATVTVADLSGKVVTSFTTSTSATTGPDGASLNYSGQVLNGTYSLTVTLGTRKTVSRQVVVKGGMFARADFSGTTGLPALYTFTAGLKFFSTPYDYSGIGFDGLFGARNTAPTGTTPNGNRSNVAVWSPTQNQYLLDPTAPADTVRLGQGYWVFLKNDVPVTQQGTTPGTAFVPQPLRPTWNMIGVPNPNGVPVSSLMFDNGAGGMITFAQASSTQYAILTPNASNIYRYDAPSNTYQPVGNGEVLQPWQAYWIRVRVPATLEIPTGAGTTTTPTTPTTATGLPGTP